MTDNRSNVGWLALGGLVFGIATGLYGGFVQYGMAVATAAVNPQFVDPREYLAYYIVLNAIGGLFVGLVAAAATAIAWASLGAEGLKGPREVWLLSACYFAPALIAWIIVYVTMIGASPWHLVVVAALALATAVLAVQSVRRPLRAKKA